MYPHKWCEGRFKEELLGHAAMKWKDFETTCLAPYISLEALKTDPSKFLGLLFARVSFSPSQWAAYDAARVKLQWEGGTFYMMYNMGCVIMNEEKYGQWAERCHEECQMWEMVGFPRGHLILRTQNYVMSLLRGVVELLVDDLPEENTSSEDQTSALASNMNHLSSSQIGFRFPHLYQPFHAPQTLDIERLLLVARRGVNITSDHTWLLQTEPSYMRWFVNLASKGEIILSEKSSNPFSSITLVIEHCVEIHWMWRMILEEVKYLMKLPDVPRAKILPG